MRHHLTLFVATAALLVSGAMAVGCSEAEDWRKAELTDSAEVYREFLEKHPDSEYAPEAIKRIEEQDYVRAVELETAAAFGEYLANHPEGSNSDAARQNHARLLFEEGKRETSAEKMARYIEMYPEGAAITEAKHFKHVYEYAENIAITDVKVTKVNLQGKEDGPLDGHAFTAKVTNNGDKSLTTVQIRMEWLSDWDVVLLQRLWYVATPPLDMYPTAEWMQVPMKPGETRDFEYEFGRYVRPDNWNEKVRLVIHDLRFEGEKVELGLEQPSPNP